MRVNTSKSIGLLLAAACGPGPSTVQATPVKPTPAEAPAKAGPPAQGGPPTSDPTAATLAQVRDDTPLPLTKLLGHTVEEVQAELGAHEGKGLLRESCVRFLPERTWFRCRYAAQRYADKTGNFVAIQVTYEDGVASAIAFDGWKHGSGAFTPEALLAAVGLTLPEPGKLQTPATGVRLWTWFNSAARLKINDRQYRVDLSVIGDDWQRAKVEVVLNDPLTPEQRASILDTAKAPEPAAP